MARLLLLEALDDLALTTANRFHGVRARSTEAILEAYARDHLSEGVAHNMAP